MRTNAKYSLYPQQKFYEVYSFELKVLGVFIAWILFVLVAFLFFRTPTVAGVV